MKYLNSYKVFEKIYIGKIGVKSYSFQYNTQSKSAFMNITHLNGMEYEMEVKGDRDTKLMKKGEKVDDKYDNFRVFYPSNIIPVYFEKFIGNWIYMFNKNRLGYKMKLDRIEMPKYGLNPYGVIFTTPAISLLEMEKLIESTKQFNSSVKKDGGFDQFTF